MTLDEAIVHAEERGSIGCSECAREHVQLAQWLKELKELRKYRWHDLRKDPNDLPNILEQVLLKVQIGCEEYEYITGCRVTGNDNGWTCFGIPVAWKEIEPHEEEE